MWFKTRSGYSKLPIKRENMTFYVISLKALANTKLNNNFILIHFLKDLTIEAVQKIFKKT